MSEPTLIQKLQAAQDAITALTAERDTFRASAESAATLTETLKAEKAKAEETCNTLQEAILAEAKSGREKFQVSESALTKANEEKAAIAAELAKAKAALANPAFVDAAMTGTKPVADDGGASRKSKSDLYAEYKSLMAKDPKAATEFYRANRAEIESR